MLCSMFDPLGGDRSQNPPYITKQDHKDDDIEVHTASSTLDPLGLNLLLLSSSTTSKEFLSQFSTCSGWRWLEMGKKSKKIAMYCYNSFMKILLLNPLAVRKSTL